MSCRVLGNMKYLLLRAQQLDSGPIDSTISDFSMDSADSRLFYSVIMSVCYFCGYFRGSLKTPTFLRICPKNSAPLSPTFTVYICCLNITTDLAFINSLYPVNSGGLEKEWLVGWSSVCAPPDTLG